VALRDKLRQLRATRVLSQADLAKLSGVSKPTIARAELGLIVPHPRTIRKLAEALGVEPPELVSPEELLEQSKTAA
jgi:transcriptional regulator with XRE-family HTH domain